MTDRVQRSERRLPEMIPTQLGPQARADISYAFHKYGHALDKTALSL
jgi:hypothetical protein